jgi:hypothetical protein
MTGKGVGTLRISGSCHNGLSKYEKNLKRLLIIIWMNFLAPFKELEVGNTADVRISCSVEWDLSLRQVPGEARGRHCKLIAHNWSSRCSSRMNRWSGVYCSLELDLSSAKYSCTQFATVFVSPSKHIRPLNFITFAQIPCRQQSDSSLHSLWQRPKVRRIRLVSKVSTTVHLILTESNNPYIY